MNKEVHILIDYSYSMNAVLKGKNTTFFETVKEILILNQDILLNSEVETKTHLFYNDKSHLSCSIPFKKSEFYNLMKYSKPAKENLSPIFYFLYHYLKIVQEKSSIILFSDFQEDLNYLKINDLKQYLISLYSQKIKCHVVMLGQRNDKSKKWLNIFNQYKETFSVIHVSDEAQIKECRFNLIANTVTEPPLREEDVDSIESVIAGRQCEEFAFKILSNLYKKVIWVNDADESYQPYDFRVYNGDSSIYYFDCKGFSESPIIYLTPNEWKFFSINFQAYKLFLVSRKIDRFSYYVVNDINEDFKKGFLIPTVSDLNKFKINRIVITISEQLLKNFI